jgi:hypothetical protein
MRQRLLSVCSALSGLLAWAVFFQGHIFYEYPGFDEWEMNGFGDWLRRMFLWTVVIPGILAVVAFLSGMAVLDNGKGSRFLDRCLAVIGTALGGLLPSFGCVLRLLIR